MSQALVESHPKWNHDEFLCFLLLYAAMADMQFSVGEKELILDKVNPSCLTLVKTEFDVLNDYERLNVIGSYKEKFHNTPEQKAELLVRIEEIFEIDGTYTTTEHNLFMMLRRLL